VPSVPLPREYETQSCPLARSLEIVGERWTLLILRDLFFGVRRFGELQARLDIPRAVLSARLATLVEHGLVERRPYRPGRDELHLTERAQELWPIVHGLMQWGERHLVADGPLRLFAHAECGTPLTADGRCPRCDVEPAPADIETRPGPGKPPVLRDDAVSRALRRPHRLLTPVETAHARS
jgi:DNA-binding HxlR family transcriptional regulator